MLVSFHNCRRGGGEDKSVAAESVSDAPETSVLSVASEPKDIQAKVYVYGREPETL